MVFAAATTFAAMRILTQSLSAAREGTEQYSYATDRNSFRGGSYRSNLCPGFSKLAHWQYRHLFYPIPDFMYPVLFGNSCDEQSHPLQGATLARLIHEGCSGGLADVA